MYSKDFIENVCNDIIVCMYKFNEYSISFINGDFMEGDEDNENFDGIDCEYIKMRMKFKKGYNIDWLEVLRMEEGYICLLVLMGGKWYEYDNKDKVLNEVNR